MPVIEKIVEIPVTEKWHPSREAVEERFWKKVEKTDDCWIWGGCRDRAGYGFFGVWSDNKRKGFKAHRFAWIVTYGEIPEGLCVCHTCDNPPCVNPDHLWLGTLKENHDDMVAKGRRSPDLGAKKGQNKGKDMIAPERRARGSRGGNASLSESDIPEISRLYFAGATQEELAKSFGVCPSSIRFIIHGESWKHVTRRTVERGIVSRWIRPGDKAPTVEEENARKLARANRTSCTHEITRLWRSGARTDERCERLSNLAKQARYWGVRLSELGLAKPEIICRECGGDGITAIGWDEQAFENVEGECWMCQGIGSY